MATARRGSIRRRSSVTDEPGTAGSNEFVGQIGLVETGNGLPFGPVEIALAIAAAVLIYPITRLFAMLRRRWTRTT
jgi:hypothetical protein